MSQSGGVGCRTVFRNQSAGRGFKLQIYAMRKSFQELYRKCKAFNLKKKLKLSLSPSPHWPQAARALRLGGNGRRIKFLRQSVMVV